jgi:hypothetical protein
MKRDAPASGFDEPEGGAPKRQKIKHQKAKTAITVNAPRIKHLATGGYRRRSTGYLSLTSVHAKTRNSACTAPNAEEDSASQRSSEVPPSQGPQQQRSAEQIVADPISQDKEYEETRRVEIEGAKAFLSKLIPFYEKLRYEIWEQDGISCLPNHLCELWVSICEAAADERNSFNYQLDMLGVRWFTEADRAHAAFQRLDQAETELQQCEVEAARCHEVLDSAVSNQTQVLLQSFGEKGRRPVPNEDQQAVIETARQRVVEVSRSRAALEQCVERHVVEVEAISQSPLMWAEEALIEAHLLEKREVQIQDFPGPEGRATPLCYRRDRKRDDGLDEASTNGCDGDPEESHRPPAKVLKDKLQTQRRRELKQAEHDLKAAEAKNQTYRDTYHEKLIKFLQDVEDGDVVGTVEEFDFLRLSNQRINAENECNARQRYEFAKREAKLWGAFEDWELTSEFDDASYGGACESDRPKDRVEILKDKRIEEWRRDERQKYIQPEDQWVSNLLEEDPTSKPIAPDPDQLDWDDRACGTKRKYIDKCEERQTALRRKLNSDRFLVGSEGEASASDRGAKRERMHPGK